jgi:hypothetical protein
MSKNTDASALLDVAKTERRSAAYWRQRAAEARASAAKLADGEAKATLQNIATTYESMARLAELKKKKKRADT